MAALNLTTADKIDALTESLWKSTQEAVPQIVARILGTVSQDEMAFVWYVHKMMATDADNHDDVDSLFSRWFSRLRFRDRCVVDSNFRQW